MAERKKIHTKIPIIIPDKIDGLKSIFMENDLKPEFGITVAKKSINTLPAITQTAYLFLGLDKLFDEAARKIQNAAKYIRSYISII